MYIIAYGSLMDSAQLSQTLGRTAQLRLIILNGVARIFNAPFAGYAYLNLRFDPNSSVEAAWFMLQPSELVKFAEREAGSVLSEVAPGYYAFVWPNPPSTALETPRSYLELCQTAAIRLGIDFEIGLIRPARIAEDLNEPIYT